MHFSTNKMPGTANSAANKKYARFQNAHTLDSFWSTTVSTNVRNVEDKFMAEYLGRAIVTMVSANVTCGMSSNPMPVSALLDALMPEATLSQSRQ